MFMPTTEEFIQVDRKIYESRGRAVYEVRRSVPGNKQYALKQLPLETNVTSTSWRGGEEASALQAEVDIFSEMCMPGILSYITSWIGNGISKDGVLPLPYAARPGRSISRFGQNTSNRIRQAHPPPRATVPPHSPKAWNGRYLYILMDLAQCDLWTALMECSRRSFGFGSTADDLTARMMKGRAIDDKLRWRWTMQLAQGIEYIAEIGVVHRDINPWNIFVRGGDVLIADFGISMHLAPGLTAFGDTTPGAPPLDSSCKSSLYSAPELGSVAGYDHRVDIYSWALVVLVLWLDSPCSQADSKAHLSLDVDAVVEILEQVRTTGSPPRGWVGKHPRLIRILKRALERDPLQRCTASDVVKSLHYTEVLWADTRFQKISTAEQMSKWVTKSTKGLSGGGFKGQKPMHDVHEGVRCFDKVLRPTSTYLLPKIRQLTPKASTADHSMPIPPLGRRAMASA